MQIRIIFKKSFLPDGVKHKKQTTRIYSRRSEKNYRNQFIPQKT